MESSKIFTKEGEELKQLYFAIKLNVSTNAVKDSELTKLFKILRKNHKGHFKRSNNQYQANISGGIIFDSKNDRDIIVAPDIIEYREKRKFDKTTFNNICEQLYNFYVKFKDVDPEDIKVLGKVYNFQYEINQNVNDLIKRKTGLFINDDISFIDIRTTVLEGDKNIHLRLNSIAPKDDELNQSNILNVRLDINNRDQEEGLMENSFKDIIDFADNYADNRLIETLNNNLVSS